MLRNVLIFVCLSVAILFSGRANDSTARIGTGGLVLTKTDSIRMVEEVLEISQKQIRVRYTYVNDSSADITTVVAFPMPRFGWNPGESALDGNVGPLTEFQTWVDGVPVKSKTQVKETLHNSAARVLVVDTV